MGLIEGGEQKLFGFGLRAFKKYPELIPLASFLSFAGAMGIGYTIYSAYQKSDVTLVKTATLPPWERVNPEERQKLLTLNQRYQKIPEVEQLKAEIGSYSPYSK